jgi:cobalamin biosynthesis Mg chelatase CobN
MYYSDRLNRYFSVPYSSGTPMDNPVQAEEVMQEGIKDEPHEIVHKDTGKTVSTHKNYKDAYSAYQDLSKASDHAIGHIPKKTNEEVVINHIDGTVSTLDEQTADAIDAVFEQLSEDNQVKFSNLLKESQEGLNKVLDFVSKQTT